MLERYATLTSNTQNDQPDIHIQLEENLLRQVPTHLIVIVGCYYCCLHYILFCLLIYCFHEHFPMYFH